MGGAGVGVARVRDMEDLALDSLALREAAAGDIRGATGRIIGLVRSERRGQGRTAKGQRGYKRGDGRDDVITNLRSDLRSCWHSFLFLSWVAVWAKSPNLHSCCRAFAGSERRDLMNKAEAARFGYRARVLILSK